MVTYEEARQVAGFYGIKYYETSAKDNKYIQELYLNTAMEVYTHFFPNENSFRRKETIDISKHGEESETKQKRSCCG
jgi:predicted methyltransferase